MPTQQRLSEMGRGWDDEVRLCLRKWLRAVSWKLSVVSGEERVYR